MSKPSNIIIAACGLVSLSAHAATISDFYGKWRLDKLAGTADISESPQAGRRDVGKTLIISSRNVKSTSDGRCDSYAPRYSLQPLAAVLTDWQIQKQDLELGPYQLPETVGVVDTPCPEGIVLTRNELLLSMGDGFIYLASRESLTKEGDGGTPYRR